MLEGLLLNAKVSFMFKDDGVLPLSPCTLQRNHFPMQSLYSDPHVHTNNFSYCIAEVQVMDGTSGLVCMVL